MGFRGSAAVAPPVHDPLPIGRAAVEGFPLSPSPSSSRSSSSPCHVRTQEF